MSKLQTHDPDAIEMPRRKRDTDEMDITPMIDITFLLLIFFVVASKMDPSQTGVIPTADNGSTVSADDAALIFIKPGSDDDAIVLRRDKTPFSDDTELQASEIVEYVDSEINRTEGKSKDHVMLMGDATISVSHVTRVQQIVGDAFEDLEFTYIAVKED